MMPPERTPAASSMLLRVRQGLGPSAFAFLDVEDLEVDGAVAFGELGEHILSFGPERLELHTGTFGGLTLLHRHTGVVGADDDLPTAPGAAANTAAGGVRIPRGIGAERDRVFVDQRNAAGGRVIELAGHHPVILAALDCLIILRCAADVAIGDVFAGA